MEPEITALAQGAGVTLVTLMTTDAWQRSRDGIVQLWRRIHPERAEAVAEELEASRQDALTAAADNDQETLDGIRRQWRNMLIHLLADQPEAAQDLRRLLDEIDPKGTPAVTQRGKASGHARIYQAGRDQHIHDR